MACERRATERRLERAYRRYADAYGVALVAPSAARTRHRRLVTLAGVPGPRRRLKAAVDQTSPALKALRRPAPVSLGLELSA